MTASTVKVTANSQRTDQLSWWKARICCPHPSGDSHDGQALRTSTPLGATVPEASPIARSRKDPPRTAAASPTAPRWLSETCAVTATRAANTAATAPVAAPAAIDPGTGRPCTSNATVTATATARLAPQATPRAAASRAWRPTTVDSRSSARPVSSSCLVWRATICMDMIDARTAIRQNISTIVIAPMLVPDAGPSKAREIRFAAPNATVVTRSCASSP